MITAADIGRLVEDGAGRRGILRDVMPDYEDPAVLPGERRKRPAAFLRPVGGGREWLASPDGVKRVPDEERATPPSSAPAGCGRSRCGP